MARKHAKSKCDTKDYLCIKHLAATAKVLGWTYINEWAQSYFIVVLSTILCNLCFHHCQSWFKAVLSVHFKFVARNGASMIVKDTSFVCLDDVTCTTCHSLAMQEAL